jgi:hypothetical protein
MFAIYHTILKLFHRKALRYLSSAKKTLNHMAWEKNAMGNRRMNQGRECRKIKVPQEYFIKV